MNDQLVTIINALLVVIGLVISALMPKLIVAAKVKWEQEKQRFLMSQPEAIRNAVNQVAMLAAMFAEKADLSGYIKGEVTTKLEVALKAMQDSLETQGYVGIKTDVLRAALEATLLSNPDLFPTSKTKKEA